MYIFRRTTQTVCILPIVEVWALLAYGGLDNRHDERPFLYVISVSMNWGFNEIETDVIEIVAMAIREDRNACQRPGESHEEDAR